MHSQPVHSSQGLYSDAAAFSLEEYGDDKSASISTVASSTPSHGAMHSHPRKQFARSRSGSTSAGYAEVSDGSKDVGARRPSAEINRKALAQTVKALGCVAGIYFFFVLQGIFQQRLYQIKSDTTKFKFTFTLMASVTISASFVAKLASQISRRLESSSSTGHHHQRTSPFRLSLAAVASSSVEQIWDNTGPKGHRRFHQLRARCAALWRVPAARDIALCSTSFVFAKFTGWHALTLVDFPSQALSKCAKPVAVFIVAFFTKTQSYSAKQIVIVVWIVASLFVFNMAKPYTSKTDVHSAVIGNVLLLVSLICEGFTADRQDKLAIAHSMTGLEMMEYVNTGAIFLIVPLVIALELKSYVEFCLWYPQVVFMTAVFAISSAIGQIFLYSAISLIGALHTSLVTTSRKLLMVLISVLLFEGTLLPLQWTALASVFAAVLTKTFMTYIKFNADSFSVFRTAANKFPSVFSDKGSYDDEEVEDCPDVEREDIGGSRRDTELPTIMPGGCREQPT